jgi:hypothetical protein
LDEPAPVTLSASARPQVDRQDPIVYTIVIYDYIHVKYVFFSWIFFEGSIAAEKVEPIINPGIFVPNYRDITPDYVKSWDVNGM